MDKDETYICEDCGKEFPMYVDNQLNVSQGANFGWGPMYWCYGCKPIPEPEVIIEQMMLFMFPKKEMPDGRICD